MSAATERAQAVWETRKKMREMCPDEKWPNLIKESIFRGKNRELIPNAFSLSDQKTGQTYSFVTSEYEVLLHEEVASTLYDAIDALKDKWPDYKIKHEFLQGGAKYIAKVEFLSDQKPVKMGDPVAPFITIRNSYDKTWARDVTFGATQLVCTNGLVRPVESGRNRQKHITGSTVGQMSEIIEQYLTEDFPGVIETWKNWSGIKVTMEEAAELFDKMPFSISEVDKMQNMKLMGDNKTILQLVEGQTATVWDINRVATQYLTHEVKSPMRTLVDTEKVSRILTQKY
ncbi:MAG: DUF932 domain-containing protein [Bacilli bacterium]|nr:DUF932 domain-containing protein [Bacilli bacterium]